MSESEQFKVERRDHGVVWLTVNRPDAMNALSGEVLNGFVRAAAELGKDAECRVVVVTGAGTRAFSAGADLKERRGMTDAQTHARINLINEAFNALAAMPKPTIAALNGVAFGGGLELALACDFRVAAEGAQLGLTEVRLGIMPGAGGTQRLTRVVGQAHAKEMILLGRRITAEQAQRIGLVSEVVPADALDAEVKRICEELAGSAPVSVAMAKSAIDRGLDVALDEGLKIERACYEVTLATQDRNEGLAAFAEKRPPKYQGK